MEPKITLQAPLERIKLKQDNCERINLQKDTARSSVANVITPRKRKRTANRGDRPHSRNVLESSNGEQTDKTPILSLPTTPSRINDVGQNFLTPSPFSRPDLTDTPDLQDDDILPRPDDLKSAEGASQLSITSYERFIEAVSAAECPIYQLSVRLFITKGWSENSAAVTSPWYHLHVIPLGPDRKIICMCPNSKRNSDCFHSRFMQEYGTERFAPNPDIPVLEERPFLFLRQLSHIEEEYINLFSVPAPHHPSLKNRVVVEHIGPNDGTGSWKCSSEPLTLNCAHVIAARHSLQQHIQADVSARDTEADVAMTTYLRPPVPSASNKDRESVSFRPLPPPIWARIPSDPDPPDITTLKNAPTLIVIEDAHSTCYCQTERMEYNPLLETKTKPCTIYTLNEAWSSVIEVQHCSKCKRRDIGPDCREIGLFNWNNRILFTHHLLNDYLNSFTASETPIRAFHNITTRRYQASSSPIPFVSNTLFGSVLFSYVRLLTLEGGMECPKCGPNPEAVIFDGVSISFDMKEILSSLKPPTIPHPTESASRETIRQRNLQFLSDITLRKKIRLILTGPPLNSVDFGSLDDLSIGISSLELDEGDSVESGSSEEEEVRKRNHSRKQAALKKTRDQFLDRRRAIPLVLSQLKALNEDLCNLFEFWFGIDAIRERRQFPEVYRKLYIQISAEETALQMINYPAIQRLKNFIETRDAASQSYLICIPALYNVLEYENSTYGNCTVYTFGICQWLYLRAEFARKTLLLHETEPPNPTIQDKEGHWSSTGCFYEKPQIRYRPMYPQLQEDKKTRDHGLETKGGCRKFFLRYSPRKLTGGILIPWCTHSVAYGFHCIPLSEGRNDVFSALYTRWEKAPPIIIYDFACALQPYCMLREPAFFQDSLFVIDDFHSSDHTKCCPSSFLRTYGTLDSGLGRINSSAAECGNGGLAKIRKSIRYMTQEHSIVFTKIFLSIWNRLRIQSMLQKSSKST